LRLRVWSARQKYCGNCGRLLAPQFRERAEPSAFCAGIWCRSFYVWLRDAQERSRAFQKSLRSDHGSAIIKLEAEKSLLEKIKSVISRG